MTDEQKALNDIKGWLIAFAMVFAIWAGISTALYITIVRDIRAFNSCEGVEDDRFTACFEDAKR